MTNAIIKNTEELFEIKECFESINRKQPVNILMLKSYYHYFKSLFILGDLKTLDFIYFISNIIFPLIMVFCATGIYFDRNNFILLPVSFVLFSFVFLKTKEQLIDMKNRITLNPINQARKINEFLQVYVNIFDSSFKINNISELTAGKEKINNFINSEKERLKKALNEKNKEKIDHVFLLTEDRYKYFDHTSDFHKNRKVFKNFLLRDYLTSPDKNKVIFLMATFLILVVLSGIGFLYYNLLFAIFSSVFLIFSLFGLLIIASSYDDILFNLFCTCKIDAIETDLLKNTSIAFHYEISCQNKGEVFDLYWDSIDSLLSLLKKYKLNY